MILVSFYRVIKFAWQGFWRNIWLSLITISVIILVLFCINFLIVINIITDSATEHIQNKIDVSIYFQKDVGQDKVLEVKDYLSTLSQIENISYTSQEEALEQFKKRHIGDPTILQALSELDTNPLGASLTIKAKKINDYPEIVKFLDNSKYTDLIIDKNFDDHKIFINKIENISNKINQTGIAVTAVFIFIAVLIVFNTIRVAIYTHQEEIGIMRLVGANNTFIVMPFIFEGVIYGLFGVIISIMLFYPILNFIQPYLTNFFTGEIIDLKDYFNNNFLVIFGLEFIGIIFLNIAGSMIAIRRYLHI